jgi:hypothetical protein
LFGFFDIAVGNISRILQFQVDLEWGIILFVSEFPDSLVEKTEIKIESTLMISPLCSLPRRLPAPRTSRSLSAILKPEPSSVLSDMIFNLFIAISDNAEPSG